MTGSKNRRSSRNCDVVKPGTKVVRKKIPRKAVKVVKKKTPNDRNTVKVSFDNTKKTINAEWGIVVDKEKEFGKKSKAKVSRIKKVGKPQLLISSLKNGISAINTIFLTKIRYRPIAMLQRSPAH